MTGADDIQFSVRGSLGHVLLNRPKALNALTLDMIRRMTSKLRFWAEDAAIRSVAVEGAGDRAFCAGGDVRALYEAGLKRKNGDGTERLTEQFYREEYQLNQLIFHYPKPYVAVMDGITMGGGVGVAVHGSHRIATERTMFAMPETGIGLFPDVGGSHFLPRCPGETGMYLGLTGARLNAADCLYAGIADHYIASAAIGDVADSLAALPPGDEADHSVDSVLAHYDVDPGPPTLADHREVIDRCFCRDSVEEIIGALDAELDPWAADALQTLEAKSPLSLKMTYRQLRAGAHLDFDDALTMEYRMSQGCMAGHDFFEGVRAVVIDKDDEPRWKPASLSKVSDRELDRYFMPLGGEDLIFK